MCLAHYLLAGLQKNGRIFKRALEDAAQKGRHFRNIISGAAVPVMLRGRGRKYSCRNVMPVHSTILVYVVGWMLHMMSGRVLKCGFGCIPNLFVTQGLFKA